MKHHLVAIGISKHKNEEANLNYAEKDASEFFTLFKQNVSDIGYCRLLVDQEATLSEIKTALGKELKENVKEGDAFFFFYSGHGAVVNDPKDPNIAIGFLIPYDATHDIFNSCLSVDYLKEVFESLPSKANLIFIDSCFSGVIAENGKAYPVPGMKVYKTLKSFTNTVVGNGSVVFTASKDDEMSIEDPEYKNGLFTHFVIEELQKARQKESYPVAEIFDPIATGVVARAKDKWHHDQTPTFSGKIVGGLTLPVFKKRLEVRPDIIEIPKTPELQKETFSIPVINLNEKEKVKILQDTIDFVAATANNPSAVVLDIKFEALCHKLSRKIKVDWEKTFQAVGSDISKIPGAVSEVESNSYQFMIFGVATAVYGSEKQMKIFSQHLVSLLELAKNRSGLIALIAVPEVVVVEMLYIVAVLCIARNNFIALKILLETEFDDPNYPDAPPMTLLQDTHIHYTRALTGYSTKVNEHIREFIKHQEWLIEFAPALEGKTDEFQLQANFLLVMLTFHIGDGLYADFGRHYWHRIVPFTRKIVHDKSTREQIAKIMNVKEDEVRKKFIAYLVEVKKRGLEGHLWSSINPTHLMTEQEKEELKKNQ